MTEELHVIPRDDFREHLSSPNCWCKPVQDEEDPDCWIHNALDQRERVEENGRPDA
jgi:hypothetical protein